MFEFLVTAAICAAVIWGITRFVAYRKYSSDIDVIEELGLRLHNLAVHLEQQNDHEAAQVFALPGEAMSTIAAMLRGTFAPTHETWRIQLNTVDACIAHDAWMNAYAGDPNRISKILAVQQALPRVRGYVDTVGRARMIG